MKTILIAFSILFTTGLIAQTTKLSSPEKHGNVTLWDFTSSDGAYLGEAISLEKDATIKCYPTSSDLYGKTLVMTAAYTSPKGKIAGNAYQNGVNIGDTTDVFARKANAYLNTKALLITTVSYASNQIPVYQVIKNNAVMESLVSRLKKDPDQWRFLIQKSWEKTDAVTGAPLTSGVDWLIVTVKASTLSKAASQVQGLARDTNYGNVHFNCWIDAVLLDIGPYAPYLLNGQVRNGSVFPAQQSNVLVVE